MYLLSTVSALCRLQQTGRRPFCASHSPTPHLEEVAIMLLANIVRALRSWRKFNNSLSELNRLGDRELADIGISRSDIPRVAWEDAQR
jgi:uncharacterized protein YjiS (DUF1127 family)